MIRSMTLAFLLLVTAHSDACLMPQDIEWQKTASTRLRQIYEQGRYRPNPFRTTWLPDSLGFVVVRRNAAGREQIEQHEIATGDVKLLEKVPNFKSNSNLAPDESKRIEFRKGRLVVFEPESNSRTVIAEHPPEKDISYRKPTWSADSKWILFVEADSTEVPERSMLTPVDPSYPKVRTTKFARVGATITRYRIGVFELETKTLKWLPIDSPEEGFYIGQVEWAGNKNQVLVETMSRFRDQRKFFLADVETNKVKKIFAEQSDTWAISSRSINSGLRWIDQGNSFVVITEQAAYRRAYRYSRSGEKLSTLTTGEFDLIEHASIDEAGDGYYFYASPENATEKYLYRAPLKKAGEATRITPANQPGWHDYLFSPNGKWAIHTLSHFDSPPKIELVEVASHRSVKTLETNEHILKRMKSAPRATSEFIRLQIDDEIEMDGWMIKPSNFNPEKKYPVLVYVYGEPYSQTVLNRWGTPHAEFHRLVADLGYIVVSFDNRGTPAPKGVQWRNSVFGSLGPLSTEDQAAAIAKLGEKFSFVDLNRVGIWGWSGGGSNTLNGMFRKPNTYRVGIAVVPKPQPHLYNAWFQEIYMRTPEVNAEGYRKSAPINFAKGLQGNLLIITGSGETNTHIQIVEGLVDRLIELGKSFDYMVYPNRDHGLRRGRGTAVHLRMLMIRYLEDHLKPE